MYFEKEFVFFRRFLEECNLKNSVIDPEAAVDNQLDIGAKKLFVSDNEKKTFNDFFPDIKEKTVYRVSDLFLLNYIFFRLPFRNDRKIFIIGPYLNTDISAEKIAIQRKNMNIPAELSRDIELFYSSLPVIKEEHLIFAGVNTFAKYIFDGEYENADITLTKSVAFIHGNIEAKHFTDSESLSFSVLEDRYRFENELIDAVSKGNSRKAELMMSRFSVLTFENRTNDKLRNLKNYCIIMNTLLRKAAENGGVHPYYLDKVSSEFAKKTELVSSVDNITDYMQEIMRTYCNLVRNHSTKKYSPIIQQAILRIENDLTGDLSLKMMAKLGNVSPAYFSSLFKKETGQTLTDYVNAKKIEKAKQLLKNTEYQIQTVAQLCGILDFHYFCRIFKRATGKTPTEYKNSLLIE